MAGVSNWSFVGQRCVERLYDLQVRTAQLDLRVVEYRSPIDGPRARPHHPASPRGARESVRGPVATARLRHLAAEAIRRAGESERVCNAGACYRIVPANILATKC